MYLLEDKRPLPWGPPIKNKPSGLQEVDKITFVIYITHFTIFFCSESMWV